MFRALLVAVAAVVIPGMALADSPIVRDAVGRTAGYYAGGTRAGGFMLIVSPLGYTFALNSGGRVADFAGPPDGYAGSPNALFYLSSDCSGQPHLAATHGFSGFVVRSIGSLYYAPKGTTAVSRTFQSVMGTNGCSQPISQPSLSLEAYPNDESVTGVPDADFAPPIMIAIARDVHEILRDGYESPAT